MPAVLRDASARNDVCGLLRRDAFQPQTGRFEVDAHSRHHTMTLHK